MRNYISKLTFVDAICFASKLQYSPYYVNSTKVCVNRLCVEKAETHGVSEDWDCKYSQTNTVLGWEETIKHEETCLIGDNWMVTWE